MDTLLRDIRYSTRKLLHSPGFTATVVATLALAIGATTAVFSIVNGVLLEPLALPNAERVVSVASTDRDGNTAPMSFPDFQDYRAQSRLIAKMAAYDVGTHNLTGAGGEPIRLSGARVNANFFDVLGVSSILGRSFSRGEDAKGAARTAVLSEALWRTRFGSDPKILGRSITVDGRPFTVIGVVPEIELQRATDIWLPLIPEGGEDDPSNRGGHYLSGVGLLAPGVSVDRAALELRQIARSLELKYPRTNTHFGATAIWLRDAMVGKVRPALLVMLGGVGFVLLIACANVANLMLVRASTRETEIAVRTALGAGARQLVRQLLTESLLLAGAGAIIGTSLAAWAVDGVKALGPQGVPRLARVAIDGRVLTFSVIVTLVTGVLFGLVPAIHAAKTNLGQMLRESTRGSSGRRATRRTRAMLVITEMALAVVLLVGAGLLARTFVALTRVDPGYRPENVVTMSVALPNAKYPWDQQAINFSHQLLEELQRLPEVQAVALAFGRPLSDIGMRVGFERDDRPPSTPDHRLVADVRVVTPGFFPTLRIPILSGRGIAGTDRANAPAAVVVSQAFARQFYPDENPIGKHITIGWGRQRSANATDTVNAGGEIVGIVGDIRANGNREKAPSIIYLPYDQAPIQVFSLLVRSTASATLVVNGARAAVRDVDPELPVFDVKTMTQAFAESVSQPRFYAILLGSFAGIALMIAALGIYGVISYTVTLRTRELGIRIALGAQRERVLRLVVRQGMALTLAGVAIGLISAYALSRAIASLLYGVAAADPLTFSAVTLLFLTVAGVASYVPARRAAAVDPVIAMRAE